MKALTTPVGCHLQYLTFIQTCWTLIYQFTRTDARVRLLKNVSATSRASQGFRDLNDVLCFTKWDPDLLVHFYTCEISRCKVTFVTCWLDMREFCKQLESKWNKRLVIKPVEPGRWMPDEGCVEENVTASCALVLSRTLGWAVFRSDQNQSDTVHSEVEEEMKRQKLTSPGVCLSKRRRHPASTGRISALGPELLPRLHIQADVHGHVSILTGLVNSGGCCSAFTDCPVTAEKQTRAVWWFISNVWEWFSVSASTGYPRGSTQMIGFCNFKPPQGHAVIKDRLYLWNT